MNAKITDNYSRLKPSLFLPPILILAVIVIGLYWQNALNRSSYIQIQKDYFIYLNSKLSQFPEIEYNLTQLGDAFISLSLMSLFFIYAPIIWESLISVSLVSLLFSSTLKNIFAVPRPAAVYDNASFAVIGARISGHSSLPSGHSITIFTALTVLLFAFMPEKLKYRFAWITIIITAGLFLAFTRVGVGAHYPLDVIVGCTVGYVSGLAGIFISRKYQIWQWIYGPKSHPLLMVLLFVSCIALINKIMTENLPIYYLALGCLIFSLFKITHVYLENKL